MNSVYFPSIQHFSGECDGSVPLHSGINQTNESQQSDRRTDHSYEQVLKDNPIYMFFSEMKLFFNNTSHLLPSVIKILTPTVLKNR